ncbi:uncharacterized protein V1516DRAFT_627790 [Lipomyces oligophaga]|uniref:uncharacterized protein n=1 Tax=Lipomyces oligophaga TaxID=45792 RepID=UPI0034CD4D80
MNGTRRQFPVFVRVKTCGHSQISCGLTTTEQCCSCMDRRPASATGKYDVYIDGEGIVNAEGRRWDKYCGSCRQYWDSVSAGLPSAEPAAVDPATVRRIEEERRVRRRRQMRIQNAFGTLEEVARDDYVSPVTVMFQRAVDWHNRMQQRQEEERRRIQQSTLNNQFNQIDGNNHINAHTDSLTGGQSIPTPLEAEKLIINAECRICFSQIANIVFLPCAHLAVCEHCAEQVAPTPIRNRPLAHAGRLCPICRSLIKKKLKIYRA